MRSRSVRVLLVLVVTFVSFAAFGHDVTVSSATSFAALDGSASDHDGLANGVFTVSDGDLIVNAAVNCNDDGASSSACAMAFVVSGNVVINPGGALYAENRSGSGTGGAITITAGGNLSLSGSAIISTASTSSSGSTGGAITAAVSGNVSVGSGSTIDSGSANARGGDINLAASGLVSVDGNVLSGPSRTLLASRLTGVALDGGSANSIGGAITIRSTTFAEPAVLIGGNANVVSQGDNSGAGPVTIEGCGIQVRGLVAALSRKDSASRVSIRSGKDLLVDSRDLGVAGAPLGRNGRVRADAPSGTALNKGVDLFASETIDIFGPGGSLYAITSLPGLHDSKSYGGLIRIISTEDAVNATGNVIDDGHSASGDSGGTVEISAKGDVTLNTAVIRAVGDFSTNNSNRGGGSIRIRSHSGNVIWTNGLGEVRPVGSASNLPLADQGSIVLTACGTIVTTGSSFPVMGTATSMFPETHTGVCSPAAPSLPAGTPALVTCNTPPVANDTSATTNEDNTVTIILSGTDADGDSLTFSIVSGPANGVLGPVISTGPNTATVDYTPNLNFNGGDSFIFQANDGNGGTDNGSAVITVNPVNDPPSFLAGASVTVNEDAGPQTIANWATSISAGPADESGQTVTFTVTNDNPALFSVQPAVSSNGTLTFTTATNANGSANITVTAQDNGGTANGGNDTSASQTSSISVTAVNDAPSFTKGADQSVNEDAGPQTVAGWATGISAGPGEGSQTVSFVTANDNNALFSTQPAVSSGGTLTYTPAGNANGTATVTIYAQDDGGTANGGVDSSAPQTFTITVGAVNDAPSFTSGGDVTVNEDSGSYSAAWATGISAGPADEAGQTVSFSASNDNNSLFSVQPSISASGVLSFTLSANAFGSATVTVSLSDNGGTANGGADTSASQSFTINVSAVNDEPSFTGGGNVTVNEDSGPYSAAWATGISAGPGESDAVTFVVSNDNAALFASGPSISASGVLTFTLNANANGTANVSVYLTDDGGTANGGDDTSPTQSFTITVNAVNDAPSFTSGGDVSVNEDSGSYSAAWATAISAGPADEAGQALTFIVTNDNNSLFSAQPSISPSGVLTFTVAANAFGSATVTVKLSDDGGVANGGADTSATQTFTITVNAVNDAPSFTAGGNVTVNEDSGPYAAAWASSISAGPNESGQTLTFNASNDNNALFLVQPAISASGVLTFTTVVNAFGSATVTVSLSDNGGTANGGVDTSGSVTFTITVNPINDGPTAAADGWDTLGNTEIRVDLAGGLTPKVVDTTPSGTGALHNDSDPEGDPILITGITGCADVVSPYDCSFGDGSKVSLLATGQFTFIPGPGVSGGSFQYQATDVPAFGSPATTTATVTFTVYDMIWYVNATAAAGNGTSASPFNSFASLTGAGDVDGVGNYIFVHDSTVTGGIVLEAGQRLWGEGIGLIVPVNLNGNGSPATLVAPGTKARILGGAGNAVTVNGVGGVEIAGLNLSSTGADGIDVTSAPLAPATSAKIYSNTVSAAALNGVDVNAGALAGTTVDISVTTVTSTGVGVDVSGLAGTVTILFVNSSTTSATTNGMSIVNVGAPTFDVTLTGSTFASNPASGLITSFNGNSVADLTITGNIFRDNNIGLDLGSGDSADVTFVATGNTFLRQKSNAVNFVTATTSTNASQFVGTFDNNTLGDGTPDSGSRDGFGIGGDFRGDVDAILQVNGNHVRNTDFDGIFIQGRLDADADAERGRLDLTLRNNTVGQPDDNSKFPLGSVNGVRVESRNTYNLFLDIAGNTAASVGPATHFRVRQLNTSAFNLERFTGAGNSTAAVAGFVAGENAGGSTASATLATTFTGVVSGTTRKP